mmetsp:Transcript_19216/g.27032  ORF Transcript_19216/g.27032 Transcript_19216/m.27032 type:complete len:102 (-) Transcript_19216:69-374(-)
MTTIAWISKIPTAITKYRTNILNYQDQLNQWRAFGTKALFKTNKAAAKRFRVRGSGSIKRNKAGASHNTGYKTRARSNRLGQSCGIREPAIEKRMRRLIGK